MADTPPTHPAADIPAELARRGLAEWYFEDGWVRRKYTTPGWPQTMLAVNAVAFLAEAAYHHPDLAVTWGKVWVKLRTHSAGGVTDKDFELAAAIEAALTYHPAAGTALAPGNPKPVVNPKK